MCEQVVERKYTGQHSTRTNHWSAPHPAGAHATNRLIDGIFCVQHQRIGGHDIRDAQLSQIASSGELSADNVTIGEDPDSDRPVR